MPGHFTEDGIAFRYPENWRLEREENEHGWTVSLQGPGTAMLLLSLDEDMPPTDDMTETVLSALREEYQEVEADECVDSVAGQPAVGHNIRFFSFDLTNTCWTRSFYSSRGTVLLMWQVNDLELEEQEPVLQAICASVALED